MVKKIKINQVDYIRTEALLSISEEHQYSMLLCQKIREGFRKGIDLKRIKRYADWFFETYLNPLITHEEQFVFPVIGMKNPRVKRALANHRRLRRLFNQTIDLNKTLNYIDEELQQHVSYEQRIIFNGFENKANEADLAIIKKNIQKKIFEDNLEDVFWV
ncbi:hemerythrin domain-containing protein [uncultured Aquimarina sp.]|uniref:hemerythrin domain-containing protein n=1 Tax=uncultured Aquimarina sp. TaxID=575652 RepID=UPI00260AD1ED|nr:hemerythrin domain-containing protein [uncultured Aquimarina sp.]